MDRLTIFWKDVPTTMSTAEVRPLDGRVVRTELVGALQRPLDVSGLANGRYHLVLTDASGRRAQGTFTVVH